MRRHDRHASADDLASLSVGELRRRRAAKVEAHLIGCVQCTSLRNDLDGLPAMLARTPYPTMPDTLMIRIETAIHAEVRQRLADLPATEAERRELPSHRRRQAPQQGWHLPGFSVRATRLVGALGAIAVIGFGSYEAVTHLGGPAPTSATSGSAGVPGTQQLTGGPTINYGPSGAKQRSVRTFRSSVDFQQASLATQADAAIHAAQESSASPGAATHAAPAPQNQSFNSAESGSAVPASGLPAGLMGCVSLIASRHVVTLVDLAYFEGKPATLIVVATTGVRPAEAFIVGSSCSATIKDVLASVALLHP